MKSIVLITFISILFMGCYTPDASDLSEEEKLEALKRKNDSLMIYFDSLMVMNIEVPLQVDSNIISPECLGSFHQLARETEGELKILVGSKAVSKTIIAIIEKHAIENTDLMLIIDKTGSMEDDFRNIREGLYGIFETLEKQKNVRLAVATYGDKNIDGFNWYDFKNFESDFNDMYRFINSIKLTGGGDYPESVFDGVYEAFQENFWQSKSKRMVILIGDAPSLDSTLSEHTIEEIIQISKKDRINMNFYPIVLSPYNEETLEVPHMERLNLISNMYPIPTTGPITINLNNSGKMVIEIYDQKGNLVKNEETTESTVHLDLYDIKAGLYLVRVYDQFKNYDEQKIIISR